MKQRIAGCFTAFTVAGLVAACVNTDGEGGVAPLDAGDESNDAVTSGAGTDVRVDVRADIEPTPCEDAPTARLSTISQNEDREEYPPHAQRKTIQVPPLTYIALSSQGSIARDGHSIERYKWKIEDRPAFGLATFGYKRLRRSYERPPVFRITEENPLLQVGLAGDYTISLIVWNDAGTISCNSAKLTVEVRPTSELYVDFRYPYVAVESDEYPGQYLYQHRADSPNLNFAFKRTSDAAWTENLDDVIPNARGETDVQDWGDEGDDADDPRWMDVSKEGPSNGLVRLDGVESNTPYFGAVSMSGTPPDETPVIFRVYVDGERTFRERRTLGANHEAPFGMEVVRIKKSGGSYDIEALSNIYDGM